MHSKEAECSEEESIAIEESSQPFPAAPTSKSPGQQGKRKKPSIRGVSAKKRAVDAGEGREDPAATISALTEQKKKYKEKIKKLKVQVEQLRTELVAEKLQYEKLKGYMEGLSKSK